MAWPSSRTFLPPSTCTRQLPQQFTTLSPLHHPSASWNFVCVILAKREMEKDIEKEFLMMKMIMIMLMVKMVVMMVVIGVDSDGFGC